MIFRINISAGINIYDSRASSRCVELSRMLRCLCGAPSISLSYLNTESALDDYNGFINGPESLVNTNLLRATVFEYRTVLKPGNYWIYIESILSDSPVNAKYCTEVELEVTESKYIVTRSPETERALSSIISSKLSSLGINSVHAQVWWFPGIIDPLLKVPMLVWPTGGTSVISFDHGCNHYLVS